MNKKELDTEFKIKEAARIIFQEKGFVATKTRDIADAADINLALLNYYFRSKKKLFEIIMFETVQSFFEGVIIILNKEETSIKEKIQAFVDHYIDLLTSNPHIAPFVLNSVREHPAEFIAKLGILENAKKSIFIKQFQEAFDKGEIPMINPLHFMLNLLGFVVFPFIVQPIFSVISGIEKEEFIQLLNERKRLIPLWVDAMLSVK